MKERPLIDYVQYKKDQSFEALEDIHKMIDNGISTHFTLL